jgi:hypothetical protein
MESLISALHSGDQRPMLERRTGTDTPAFKTSRLYGERTREREWDSQEEFMNGCTCIGVPCKGMGKRLFQKVFLHQPCAIDECRVDRPAGLSSHFAMCLCPLASGLRVRGMSDNSSRRPDSLLPIPSTSLITFSGRKTLRSMIARPTTDLTSAKRKLSFDLTFDEPAVTRHCDAGRRRCHTGGPARGRTRQPDIGQSTCVTAIIAAWAPGAIKRLLTMNAELSANSAEGSR